MLEELSSEAIASLVASLPDMPLAEKEALLQELETLEHKKRLKRCREDFLAFCAHIYPDWKEGPHHRYMKPLLHKARDGVETRLTVSMPPRFGKSETIAYLFVAWYLGHMPNHHIMMATHTAALSADFGRKVRNLLDSDKYKEIFPNTTVSKDKSAADNWTTTAGGKYLAIGIGANVAGHGAHLLVVDDLVSEQAVLANPDAAFATAWEYMQVGPLQRLMPGGRIVMIGCMTAETRVLMADGSEKELQHIKVGDAIATYDAGKIATSRVTNWIEHRSDYVYKIRTTSGKIVRANKRHPFLVDRDGVRTWIRVRDLKVGDCLVKAVPPKDVCDQGMPKGCVVPATKTKHGLKERLDRLLRRQPEQRQKPKQLTNTLSDGRVDGKGWSAPLMGVAAPSLQKGCATVATVKNRGVMESTGSLLSKSAAAILNIGTAFLRKLMTTCLRPKEAVAQYVSSRQQKKTQEQGKYQNSTLTIATTQNVYEGCSATTAIWPSATQTQKSVYLQRLSTYATTPDAIVEIVEDGFEPVFDIEVERTENFIANGVVSHNTRWGKKDPIGRALAWAENNPNSTPWTEVRFPAILPSGKSLWPEQWPVEQLLAKKAGMQPQFWAAQYMQEPTSEEGAILKREWWQIWEKDTPPDVEFVIQVWDTAHDTKSHNDFSACITWGVWFNEETSRHEIIMLNAIKGRWEFPQLKQKALDEYKEWQPECLLIEKKAAGAPLIQELRQMDLIVEEYSPSRAGAGVSNDKRARVNSVAPMLFDKVVWAPDHRWAFEVINECAEFPHGEHDDYVDVVSMALARYRRGGFVSLSSDRKDEDQFFRRRSAAYY